MIYENNSKQIIGIIDFITRELTSLVSSIFNYKKMNGLLQSARRKRNSVANEEVRERKRICLEDFFGKAEKPETILERFQNQMRKLEEEEVTLEHLKNANRTVKQLKRHNLQEKLAGNDFINLIRKLKFFLRSDFVRDFILNGEDDGKVKPDAEITFEACSMCFFLFNSQLFLDSDTLDCLNDVVFFWRKMFDNLNSHLSGMKSIRNARLKQLLLDSIHSISELMGIRNFNLLNQSGLIKSFIYTILHHVDYDIQTSALSALKLFYKKGEEFRALIINLTFNSIGSICETYKFRKTYKIRNSLYVSMFTVFILSLVENVPISGLYDQEVIDELEIQNVRNQLQESFENMMKVACFIVATFIKKRSTNHEHKAYGICLKHLISEVIEMSNEPEWPSARLMLNLLLKPLTDILGEKNESNMALKVFAVKTVHEVIKKKISDKNSFEKILDSLSVQFKNVQCEYDFPEYLQKLLISYLNKRMGNCKLIHAIQWYENIRNESDSDGKILKLLKIVTDCTKTENPMDLKTDENEQMRAIVYYLDTARKNYADYRVILKYLLLCCNDKVKKIKNLATRSVLELTTLDTDLLSHSTLRKIVLENLPYFPMINKKLCRLINDHLTNNPGKSEEYAPFLLRVMDIPCDDGKKISVDLVMKAIKKELTLELKIALSYKVLSLIQDENPTNQKLVTDFCTELWLGEKQENVNILLGMVEIPSAAKYLSTFFEVKLKPSVMVIATSTPAEPPTQTVDSCNALVERLSRKIGNDENTLHCLEILSIIANVYPKALATRLSLIASPLTRSQYSQNCAVEVLSAEITNCVLPEIAAKDVSSFISLRDELVQKLSSPESLNYSMGLTVSLLKLVCNLSKSDLIFLYDNCFEPSMKIMQEYSETERGDNRTMNKALCTAIYLHIYFPKESDKFGFPALLNYFIHHRIFSLTTIHCLCYLSMDYKLIMKNETVVITINKYLKDKSYPLLVKAVLFNILCSLKNISNGKMFGGVVSLNDNLEPVRILLHNHMNDILDCTADERSQIRQTAYTVVKQILISGLVPESRLIPSVLLMTTDPIECLANIGVETARQIPVKKLFEFTRNSGKCIAKALAFNIKCSNRPVFRGYRARNNGKMEALCNNIYILHQENVAMRQHIIDSILKDLSPEAQTNAREKLFLADNLLTFGYKYQEEVYYVLCRIELVLASARVPAVPESDGNVFVDKYYGVYILTFVKSSLMNYYHFTGEKLRKYYQEDGKRDLVNTNKFFVFDMPESSTPQESRVATLAHDISDAFKNQAPT